MRARMRLCNNPPPAFDGPRCEGSDTQTQVCKEKSCPGEKAQVGFYEYMVAFKKPLMFADSGWEVVVLGNLGSLRCFVWRWNQTEDAPLC